MNPVLPTRQSRARKAKAFTLLELLAVIAIIAVIAALTAPAISNMRKGDAMSAAVRQLMDDVAYARQRAIGDHTQVYMVFIPPAPAADPTGLPPAGREQFLQGQMRSYALFASRQVGDQPGRPTMRYISPWRTLPEGIVIAEQKFPSFDYVILPFPDVNVWTNKNGMPCIAFDYTGSLIANTNTVTIPLTRGSLMPMHPWGFDFREQPPGFSTNSYNHIVIDRLTGRARHETRRIQ